MAGWALTAWYGYLAIIPQNHLNNVTAIGPARSNRRYECTIGATWLDMAIGVTIGGAFGKILSSLVSAPSLRLRQLSLSRRQLARESRRVTRTGSKGDQLPLSIGQLLLH
jgi:hypothetical protein